VEVAVVAALKALRKLTGTAEETIAMKCLVSK